MTLSEQYSIGARVRYCGPDNPSERQQKLIGKTGVVERVIKTRKCIRLRWDEPCGPMVWDKTYEALAECVAPI